MGPIRGEISFETAHGEIVFDGSKFLTAVEADFL